jgi:hypothetical protein
MYVPTYDGLGQASTQEEIVAQQQAGVRAAVEAYARYRRDCAGIRLLSRLERKRPDPIEEYSRIKRRLDAARSSGSPNEIAAAECELSRFWWERASPCSGWEERNQQRFSKAVAEHYVQSELGLSLRSERTRCRSGGKLCEVSFPRGITVAVSLARIPNYVIARQIYTPAPAPRREYTYVCTRRGTLTLFRR